jgi:TctA family transporter
MVPMLTLGIPARPPPPSCWRADDVGIAAGAAALREEPGFRLGLIASQLRGHAMLLSLNIPRSSPLRASAPADRTRSSCQLIRDLSCSTGAYSHEQQERDVGQMLVFGILGYGWKQLGYRAGRPSRWPW